MCVPVDGIDPAYQADSQNRRCALHAAAQRGLLEVCYMLVQVWGLIIYTLYYHPMIKMTQNKKMGPCRGVFLPLPVLLNGVQGAKPQ